MTNKNNTSFPVLKTERLTLRQLVSSDDQAVFALRSDDRVNKYLGRKPSSSIQDARNFIQAILEKRENNNSIYWVIASRDDDKLIGTICLFNIAEDGSTAEIGYELLPAFQGKGIMEAAATTVIDFAAHHAGIKAIEAYTHVDNHSSTRLLEKLNFKRHRADDANFVVFKWAHSG